MVHIYPYKPIDLSRDSIRLLRLCNYYHDVNDIRCELFQAFISDDELLPYEAVSYTWGGAVDENSPTITLNSQKVSVTRNLFDALHHLRQRAVDRILWVDALCINQRDHREKGHQVGQMRQTYEKAETVLVWLGTSSVETEEVMAWMADVAGELRSMNWRMKSPPEIRNMLSPRCLPVGDTYKSLANHRGSLFTQLTKRPWFERIWIIQEITVAQKATVICGHRTISSSVFSMIPSLIGIELSAHTRAILEMMPGWLRLRSPSSQDRRLLTLLRRFRDSKSSLEQDRVYALIGLASDALKFPIDYKITFGELVSDVASHLATRTLHRRISLPQGTISYSELLDVSENEEDLFIYVFSYGLHCRNLDLLLPLIKITPQARCYEVLHKIASYPKVRSIFSVSNTNVGLDFVGAITSEFMSHLELGWKPGTLDPNELTKAFCDAVVKRENISLVERIAALEDFIISVDSLRTIVKRSIPFTEQPERDIWEPSGPVTRQFERAVSDAIKSSIIRQSQRHQNYTGKEAEGIAKAYQPTDIENWTRRILPLVTVHGDVSAVKLLLERGKYPDNSRISRAWSHGLDIMSNDGTFKAMNHAMAELFVAIRLEDDGVSDTKLIGPEVKDCLTDEMLPNAIKLLKLGTALESGSVERVEGLLNGDQ